MKKLRYPLAFVAALSLTLSVGCDKKDQETAPGGETKAGTAAQKKAEGAAATPTKLTAPDAFAQIPADTPYMLAAFEPLPSEVTDKLFAAFKPIIEQAEAEIAKELEGIQGDSPDAKLQKAILEELKGNLNKAGLEKLGISTEPRFALYGLGVTPSFRVELKDPSAFKAMIERVEKKAGMKAPVQKLGDQEYWGITEDGFTVAIAIVKQELVVGVTPEKAANDVLPILFGQKAPAKAMTAGGPIMGLASKHGFKPFFLGYIDIDRIAKILLGKGEGLNAKVWTALGSPIPPMSETCQSEIMGMVANAPRMVMGYTKVTPKEWAAKYIIETKPDLAKALKGITTPVPGLGTHEKAMFSLGLGVDIQKTLDFVKGKVAGIKAAPYKCEQFGELNKAVAEAEAALNQPLPPFVSNLKGFNVVVKDADLSGPQPQAIKAHALIRADQPDQLLAMAKGMAPPLAQLNVAKDGKPVAFPAGVIPPMVEEPHIAMNDKGIALSVGKGESANLGQVLNAKSPSDPPLLAVSYDMKKFMGLMKAQMERSMQFLPPEMQAEQKKEMEMMTSIADALGQLSYSMHLTDAGIVFEQHMFFE